MVTKKMTDKNEKDCICGSAVSILIFFEMMFQLMFQMMIHCESNGAGEVQH